MIDSRPSLLVLSDNQTLTVTLTMRGNWRVETDPQAVEDGVDAILVDDDHGSRMAHARRLAERLHARRLVAISETAHHAGFDEVLCRPYQLNDLLAALEPRPTATQSAAGAEVTARQEVFSEKRAEAIEPDPASREPDARRESRDNNPRIRGPFRSGRGSSVHPGMDPGGRRNASDLTPQEGPPVSDLPSLIHDATIGLTRLQLLIDAAPAIASPEAVGKALVDELIDTIEATVGLVLQRDGEYYRVLASHGLTPTEQRASPGVAHPLVGEASREGGVLFVRGQAQALLSGWPGSHHATYVLVPVGGARPPRFLVAAAGVALSPRSLDAAADLAADASAGLVLAVGLAEFVASVGRL